jgi:hypothetical protein
MTCSALTVISLFVLVVALASEINTRDAASEPDPDPFRLHRFRSGDQKIE